MSENERRIKIINRGVIVFMLLGVYGMLHGVNVELAEWLFAFAAGAYIVLGAVKES